MTGLTVGKGFLDEWNALLPQVIPIVQDLAQENPTYQIWVTGHSLGAAISTLCALELYSSGLKSLNVYNYGCPRVGNSEFAQYYDSRIPNTFRVVNGRDVVPTVPPKVLGFSHVATEVWENPSQCKWLLSAALKKS